MTDTEPPPLSPESALDTEDGRALAIEITELLESELVRFRHRVDHDYGIALDRARAAMVVLGRLVASGVPWTARPDSAPAKIQAAFEALAKRAGAAWASGLEDAIEADTAAFVAATAGVAIVDDPAPRAIATRLRGAGAAPEVWWWAMQFDDDLERCWTSCSSNAERLVQVALAIGISADAIARALAGAFAVTATRAKTRRTAQRNDLVALLNRLASAGATAVLVEQPLISKVTALAFEMAAAQQPWWTGGARRGAPEAGTDTGGGTRSSRPAVDGIAEIAVLSFQLVELFGKPRADLERYADVALRAERVLKARGLQLANFLKRDLDPLVAKAL